MYKEFEYKLQIIEGHLDFFGHVNNAVYLELYEQARWDFISKYGYGLTEIMEKKQGPVVLDVHCRFRRELKNREMITIKSQTLEVNGKISKMKQEMIKEDGSIASDAVFTFGFMDLKQRKLVESPKSWLIAIGAD